MVCFKRLRFVASLNIRLSWGNVASASEQIYVDIHIWALHTLFIMRHYVLNNPFHSHDLNQSELISKSKSMYD